MTLFERPGGGGLIKPTGIVLFLSAVGDGINEGFKSSSSAALATLSSFFIRISQAI